MRKRLFSILLVLCMLLSLLPGMALAVDGDIAYPLTDGSILFDAATKNRQKMEVYNHSNHWITSNVNGKQFLVYQVVVSAANYQREDPAYNQHEV